MANSILAAASSAVVSVPAEPAECEVCEESRTYIIFYGYAGSKQDRTFELAAYTHEKDITSNKTIMHASNILKFDNARDKIITAFVTKGSEFNNLLRDNSNIVHIAYFGHSWYEGLSVNYGVPGADEKMISPQLPEPGRENEYYAISRLTTANIIKSECTMYLFGCWGTDGGNFSIAQAFADHFQITVHGYLGSSIFTNDPAAGRDGKRVLTAAERKKLPTSNPKQLWLIPNTGKLPVFDHRTPRAPRVP